MIFLIKKCLFLVFVFYYYLCKKYYLDLLVLVLSRFSCVRLCTTLWTMARFLSPGASPGKKTGVGCHASRGSL